MASKEIIKLVSCSLSDVSYNVCVLIEAVGGWEIQGPAWREEARNQREAGLSHLSIEERHLAILIPPRNRAWTIVGSGEVGQIKDMLLTSKLRPDKSYESEMTR